MSWTNPRTWVTGELVTAAMLNTHVRDNLLQTAPALVTAKGDVVAATGSHALGRTGVGGNNCYLMAVSGNANGIGWSANAAVQCKQGQRRLETKNESVTTTGGSAWYSITTTWDNAFSGTPEVAVCLGSGRNQAAAVALGQVSISTTSCTVQFQYTSGQTTDVFTLHAIAVGT